MIANPEPGGEVHCGRNGWICCAFTEPETAEERSAWRQAMRSGHDALSPIRWPRAFARALAAMAAEQAGARGQTVVLRSTMNEQAFWTVHRSQTVYHGPVVYVDDPVGRLEPASSNVELLLLVVFLKHAAHRAQREYQFVVWAEEEPPGGSGGPLDLARAARRHAEAWAGAGSWRPCDCRRGGAVGRADAGRSLKAERASQGAARPRLDPPWRRRRRVREQRGAAGGVLPYWRGDAGNQS